jgi:phage gpG-like protein
MTAIEVEQLPGVLDKLVRALEGDMSEGLDLCRADIAGMFMDIFHRSQDSGGSAWPAHSPATVAKYGPHPLLILTTALMQSVTTDFGTGDSRIENSGRDLAWGTNLEYGGYNNYGTSRIPAREWLYWTDEGADAVVETLGNWIDENILGDLV